MSTRRSLRPLPLLIALAIVPFHAAGAADKYAAEFLRIGVGARALGMGGAFTAIADDASAAYWNPAGLALFDRPELLFMHAEQFDHLASHDYFGFVQPLLGSAGNGTVGIAAIRFSVDDILLTRDGWEDTNGDGRVDPGDVIRPDLFRRESDTEWGVLFSYARPAGQKWDVGANVKIVRQGLLKNTSFGMGVDLGLLYRVHSSVTVGARLADITTTQISWDTGTREVVAPSLTLGGRWDRSIPGLRGSLTLAADLPVTFEGRSEASQFGGGTVAGDFLGGLEYWFSQAIALRLGTSAGEWTAGGGLRYRGFGADYAFLPHNDLGETHRVSASVSF